MALFHYYVANAWSGLKTLSRRNTEEAWDWEQEEIEKEIFHLRKALQIASNSEIPAERTCQMLTNLGNAFSHIGRFVEAIEYWDRALKRITAYGMAQGNRGYGLHRYASQLYDKGHIALFLKYALLDLRTALNEPLYDDAEEGFITDVKQLEAVLSQDFITQKDNLHDHSLGQSKQEIQYRTWALKNRLFLNPLNDLGPYPLAARDIFTIYSIVVDIGEGPYYHGFFNQMKQEYVTARYLYYEGISEDQPHFSDRDVLLFNTLDYPSYSSSTERVKAAFRIIYSLFDKIAYFLNHYLGLSIPDKKITFRTLWYVEQNRKKELRPEFQRRQNWPLRGLFWLSKDLYEDKLGFKETIEPDAKELRDIRNHLEHKYLKLHDNFWRRPSKIDEDVITTFTDKLSFSLYRREFDDKTLRLIKMARAALVYLSLAINNEERQRAKERGPDDIIPHTHLSEWDDEWKR